MMFQHDFGQNFKYAHSKYTHGMEERERRIWGRVVIIKLNKEI
jgi:hypothetical protein